MRNILINVKFIIKAIRLCTTVGVYSRYDQNKYTQSLRTIISNLITRNRAREIDPKSLDCWC